MPSRRLAVAACLCLAVLTVPRASRAEQTQSWPPRSGPQGAPVPVPLAELRSGGVLGLGFALGSRTGLALKVWPSRPHGLTFDLGGTPFTNSASLALGYQFHARPIRSAVGVSAQFTVGVGLRLRLLFAAAGGGGAAGRGGGGVVALAVLGPRIPLGMSFLLREFPVEAFVEVAPAFDVWQAFGVDVEGIAGVRIYAGERRPNR